MIDVGLVPPQFRRLARQAAAAAAQSANTRTSGQPLVVAGLALLVLALASGSLLSLLARTNGLRWRG